MLIWCHGIVLMGLFFPAINKLQTSQVWHHSDVSDVIIANFAQIADSQWNTGKNWIFGISPGVLLIKEGNDVSNIYVKIQNHAKKIIFFFFSI